MRLAPLVFFPLLLPGGAAALNCPPQPQQVARDWQVSVEAAVGKLGPVTGGNFDAQAKAVVKDLFEMLPNAERVYLEQMLFVAYCSSLRDDRTLSEAQKREDLKQYYETMREALVRTAFASPYQSLPSREMRRVENARSGAKTQSAAKPAKRAPQGPDLKGEIERYANYLEGEGDIIAALLQAKNMPKERDEFIQLNRRRIDAVRSANLVEADRLSKEIRVVVSELLPPTIPRWTGQSAGSIGYQEALVLNYLEALPTDEPLADFLTENWDKREP